MLKKNKFLLILFIILFIGFFKFNIYSSDDSTVSSVNQNVDIRVVRLDVTAVDNKFREIRNIPYNDKSMNCKNKSELFAEYLKENGAQDVSIVIIVHKSGVYSHEFVEWSGHFYDLCNNEVLSYKLSKKEYLHKLEKIGFTGLTVESPYST